MKRSSACSLWLRIVAAVACAVAPLNLLAQQDKGKFAITLITSTTFQHSFFSDTGRNQFLNGLLDVRVGYFASPRNFVGVSVTTNFWKNGDANSVTPSITFPYRFYFRPRKHFQFFAGAAPGVSFPSQTETTRGIVSQSSFNAGVQQIESLFPDPITQSYWLNQLQTTSEFFFYNKDVRSAIATANVEAGMTYFVARRVGIELSWRGTYQNLRSQAYQVNGDIVVQGNSSGGVNFGFIPRGNPIPLTLANGSNAGFTFAEKTTNSLLLGLSFIF